MILRTCPDCGDLDCCDPDCPDHKIRQWEEQDAETPSLGAIRPSLPKEDQ